MTELKITGNAAGIRLLGRMDRRQDPIALDWTGSGMSFRLRGSDCWAELEAPEKSPLFWMIVLADGCPVTRFPVEPGCRFYPLLLGMEADKARTVTLMKETQCMPDNPGATVLLRTLRYAGTLEELESPRYRLEFLGDSLTSGEGSLAPKGNEEWITPWFSAYANYAFLASQALGAEHRVLSQSGWGVCWDWQHDPAHTVPKGYEWVCGVLEGEAAAARGCDSPYDFSAWRADAVCIRLGTNDAGGMRAKDSLAADREALIAGCVNLLERVRRNNPGAKIVWILPGTDCHPELFQEAMNRVSEAGMEGLSTFTLPDYTPEDYGARAHPNAAWNRMAGGLLADYLRTILA